MIDRAVERVDDVDQPVDGAIVGGARADAELGADRRHDRQLVLHRIEDRDDARADQDRVGHVDRLRLRLPAAAPSAAPCRRRGSRRRRPTSAAGRPGTAMRLSPISLRSAASEFLGAGREARKIRRARDLRACALGAEEQIRIEAEHRIAPAHRAAFDRFQQKGVPPAAGELQEGGDRGFEVGDEPGEDELRLALRVRSSQTPRKAGSTCIASRRRRRHCVCAWPVSC